MQKKNPKMYEYKELTLKMLRALSEENVVYVDAFKHLHDMSLALSELHKSLNRK